jgi:hypothetical protein
MYPPRKVLPRTQLTLRISAREKATLQALAVRWAISEGEIVLVELFGPVPDRATLCDMPPFVALDVPAERTLSFRLSVAQREALGARAVTLQRSRAYLIRQALVPLFAQYPVYIDR